MTLRPPFAVHPTVYFGMAGAVLGALLIPERIVSQSPRLCPFHAAYRRPCPTCGLTRSFIALGHGNVRRATDEHAFGPFLFMVFAVAPVIALVAPARKRALSDVLAFGSVLIAIPWGAWAIRRALTSTSRAST